MATVHSKEITSKKDIDFLNEEVNDQENNILTTHKFQMTNMTGFETSDMEQGINCQNSDK